MLKIRKGDELVKECEGIRTKYSSLEVEICTISKDLAVKENEVMELREQIQQLENKTEE